MAGEGTGEKRIGSRSINNPGTYYKGLSEESLPNYVPNRIPRTLPPDTDVAVSWTDPKRLKRNKRVKVGEIFFSFNSAMINHRGRELVEYLCEVLVKKGEEENVQFILEIVGHADHRGNEDYNQRLGRRRAEAVASVIQLAVGVKESLVTPRVNELKSEGKLQAKKTEDKEHLAQDRRADIFALSAPLLTPEENFEINRRYIQSLLENQKLTNSIRRLQCVINKLADPSIDDRYLLSKNTKRIKTPEARIDFESYFESFRNDINILSKYRIRERGNEMALKRLLELNRIILENIEYLFYLGTKNEGRHPGVQQAWRYIEKGQKNQNHIYSCYGDIK